MKAKPLCKGKICFLALLQLLAVSLVASQAHAYNLGTSNRQADRIVKIDTGRLGPVGWQGIADAAIDSWNNFDGGFSYIANVKFPGSTIRHELGHTLVLYHVSNPNAIMDTGPGMQGVVRQVGTDDANGARDLYPNWFVNTTSGTAFNGDQTGFQTWYGTQLGDKGLTGDFNGDGRTDMLVYRPRTAQWFVKLFQGDSFSGGWHVTWGNTSGDTPLVGDMNGDGRDDIVIYRTNGTFPNIFVNLSNGSTFTGTADSASWGLSSDQPIIGNFNGAGAEDIMIYRASSKGWYVNLGYAFDGSTDFQTGWGNSGGDTPLVNDFNQDGRADLGIFRTGSYPDWFTRMSTGGGFTGTGGFSTSWGDHDINTEKPLVGNFNGTGGGDVAMFRYWQN